MKGRVLSYKMVGLLFVLLLSSTTMTGAEYRGDQSISPFMRFLRGLFWGGSGTATRFEHRSQGQTYQFSSLAIGSSKTGASPSSGSASQQDIWAGYGKSVTTSGSVGKAVAGSSKSFGRSNNSNFTVNSQQTDGYVSALSASAATSSSLVSSSASPSSSSSASDAVSVSMPSVMTMQRASSQFTMTTLASAVNGTTQPQVDTDGFGTNGLGAAEPAIQTPIGDGSWVLLFLLSLYVYVKRKRFLGQFFHA